MLSRRLKPRLLNAERRRRLLGLPEGATFNGKSGIPAKIETILSYWLVRLGMAIIWFLLKSSSENSLV